MKVESLIFDMDGTLWDSAENVAIMRMTILGSMEENSMMALRIHWQSYQKRTGFI